MKNYKIIYYQYFQITAIEFTLSVTDNEAANRIPSSCDMITRKKTCLVLFQEFEHVIDGMIMNHTMDTKSKNKHKQFMISHFCGKHWHDLNKLDEFITCKADTPGRVEQSCPDMCNGISGINIHSS